MFLQEVPLYYEIPRLHNIVKQSQDKLTHYTSALLNAGYTFSLRFLVIYIMDGLERKLLDL